VKICVKSLLCGGYSILPLHVTKNINTTTLFTTLTDFSVWSCSAL